MRSTSVENFFEEMVDDSDSTIDTKLKKLRQAYIFYCKEYRIPPESSRQFNESVRDLGYEIEAKAHNVSFVRGVSLRQKEGYLGY